MNTLSLLTIRNMYINLHSCRYVWMFPKIGVFPPKSSHYNRVFHYKPSILGYPYFWKHPYASLYFILITIENLCPPNPTSPNVVVTNALPQGHRHTLATMSTCSCAWGVGIWPTWDDQKKHPHSTSYFSKIFSDVQMSCCQMLSLYYKS